MHIIVVCCVAVERDVVIKSNVSKEMMLFPQSASLTCKATTKGCNVKELIWTGPDGNEIKREFYNSNGKSVVSSTVVTNSTFGGQYTCTVTDELGSVTRHYDVSG